jgi:hypothetical protein
MVISLAKLLKTLRFFAPDNIQYEKIDAFWSQIVSSIVKLPIHDIQIDISFRKAPILF